MSDGWHTVPVLEGRHVRLDPLTEDHVDALTEVGLDPELWALIPTPVEDGEGMRRWVNQALAGQRAGTMLPFAIRLRASGQVVGSTRYCAIEPEHRRLEIGWTWVARPWQRSPVNTEAKLLLLGHAFTVLGCRRVEFKTDALNAVSRAAILRLGAREEGTFRRHMTTRSGRVRDSVYFSILDMEWPAIRERLAARLAAGGRQRPGDSEE